MVEWWCIPLALAAGAALHAILEEQKPQPSTCFDYSAELHIKRLESDLRAERSANENLLRENDSLKKEIESLRAIVVDGVVLAVRK